MITGSIVAMATPMHADGQVDWENLDQLVEFHIKEGTDAIVAVGTSGESATLDTDEHIAVIERVVKVADGRRPVIAGTGANSTSEAIELTQEAKRVGADACQLAHNESIELVVDHTFTVKLLNLLAVKSGSVVAELQHHVIRIICGVHRFGFARVK
jgi:dihydrodipicolinate synthase/N-acetylneuraminate lyase